jgi:hypothetical protein
LKINPVLYGSLGLQYVTGHGLCPQDIDILVPQDLLKARGDELRHAMENLRFILADIHEHQFHKGSLKVAFAQVDYAALRVEKLRGADLKVLESADYLKVYTRSSGGRLSGGEEQPKGSG